MYDKLFSSKEDLKYFLKSFTGKSGKITPSIPHDINLFIKFLYPY